MEKNHSRIVIIGAGSLFFGRQAIWAVNHLSGLKGCTLALVDTDPVNLDRMAKLAELAVETSGSGTRIEVFDHFEKALPEADFVVLSFSERNAHYRRIDCDISANYGIRMCSGDTIGPGGIFRTIREFPKILEIARKVEEICPEAWLINYINPSAIMGIGLMRHSKTRNFALCDGHHMPYVKERFLKEIGEEPGQLKNLDMRIAGVNHFTWMLKAELDGVDITPRLVQANREAGKHEYDQGYSKERFNHTITAELAETFGIFPTITAHTKEYIPYYQGRSPICEPVPPLSVFDCDERDRITTDMWNEIEDYISGKRPMDEFHRKYKSDHATDIIETMLTGNGRTYFINRSNSSCTDGNGRAIGNLPEDAFLEMECVLDADGPRPLPVGDFPCGIRSQQMLILDLHELTIEAIMKQDKSLLVRALAMDPLVNSIATAKRVIDDLAQAQREIMPDWIFTAS